MYTNANSEVNRILLPSSLLFAKDNSSSSESSEPEMKLCFAADELSFIFCEAKYVLTTLAFACKSNKQR